MLRDDEAHQHAAVAELFLIVELAAPVLESADGRHAERAAAAVGEVQAPLARLRVVEAQRQRLDVAGGAV